MPQLPVCPAEVGGPVVHQAAPAIKEITARIRCLGGVAYCMGERGLDHFARCVCPLRRLIPKARPEPMRHGGDAEFFDPTADFGCAAFSNERSIPNLNSLAESCAISSLATCICFPSTSKQGRCWARR